MNLNPQNCLVQVKASIEKAMGELHKQVINLPYIIVKIDWKNLTLILLLPIFFIQSDG
jgi:hypothetical protein